MITIPVNIWERMLDAFVEGHARVERVAYLDGVEVGDGVGVVTTLTFPRASCRTMNFTVSSEDMSAAGKHLRSHRLRRLAQVHTHPSEWTGHSEFDDVHAYSQYPGSVSIVLPSYASERPGLQRAGVHIRERDGWRELMPAEIKLILRVVPSEIDLRGSNR